VRAPLPLLALVPLLAAAQAPAQEVPGALQADAWISATAALFDRNPRVRALREGIDASRVRARAALAQAPLALETSVEAAAFQPVAEADPLRATRPLVSAAPRATLTYRDRGGLRAEARAGAGFIRTAQPGGAPDSVPAAVAVDLSYDLLGGGREGIGWTRARLDASEEEQALLAQRQGVLARRLEYLRGLVELWVTACKLQELRGARSAVGRSVQEGKAQVDARTISYKDYLNFLDLENRFSRQLTQLENRRQIAAASLTPWGAGVDARARELERGSLDCHPELEPLLQRAEREAAAHGDFTALASRLPVASAARTAVEAVLSWRPEISPYASVGYGREGGTGSPLGEVRLGVLGRWDVPGARGTLELEAARRQAQVSEAAAQAALEEGRTALRTLASEIAGQRQIFEVLQSSLRTSAELLRTLDAQRAIGSVDSLSYASAYLGSIEARFALLESWGTTDRSLRELGAYLELAGEEDHRAVAE